MPWRSTPTNGAADTTDPPPAHHRRKGLKHPHRGSHAHRKFHHVHRKKGYHVHRTKGYHVHRTKGYHVHRRKGLKHPHRGSHAHRRFHHRKGGWHIKRHGPSARKLTAPPLKPLPEAQT